MQDTTSTSTPNKASQPVKRGREYYIQLNAQKRKLQEQAQQDGASSKTDTTGAAPHLTLTAAQQAVAQNNYEVLAPEKVYNEMPVEPTPQRNVRAKRLKDALARGMSRSSGWKKRAESKVDQFLQHERQEHSALRRANDQGSPGVFHGDAFSTRARKRCADLDLDGCLELVGPGRVIGGLGRERWWRDCAWRRTEVHDVCIKQARTKQLPLFGDWGCYAQLYLKTRDWNFAWLADLLRTYAVTK